MSVILVTYSGASHPAGIAAASLLETYDHCRSGDAVWLVDTADDCATLRANVSNLLGDDAELFVSKLTSVWTPEDQSCESWLRSDERAW